MFDKPFDSIATFLVLYLYAGLILVSVVLWRAHAPGVTGAPTPVTDPTLVPERQRRVRRLAPLATLHVVVGLLLCMAAEDTAPVDATPEVRRPIRATKWLCGVLSALGLVVALTVAAAVDFVSLVAWG